MAIEFSARKPRAEPQRIIGLAIFVCLIGFIFYSFLPHFEIRSHAIAASQLVSSEPWEYNITRDAGNYGLSEQQCTAAFPKLFRPIEKSMARLERPISHADTVGDVHWGECRAMIYDNEIYVLDDWPDAIADNRKFATLHAINRAMTAVASTGHRFPNIEFSLAFQDRNADLSRPNWAYDRHVDDPLTILMPDFGLYSWPAHNVGTYSEVRRRIKTVQDNLAFEDKIPKLLWRGTLGFGSETRGALVNVSTGQPWSAVEELKWQDADFETHSVTMPDHCRYKFLAQTEGLAYSGRLKYLHNCESVILAHEFHFETHDQHLMVPSGSEQNYVAVKYEFSDLPEKMEWLLTHPEKAARIARNNVATFRDRYLTPAAEGCYWRKLIQEWGAHSFEPEFYKEGGLSPEWRGVPYESFALQRGLSWNAQAVG